MAKAGNTVLICSKLPTALILMHPMSPASKVTLKGINNAPRGTNGQPIAVPYMATEVDADFWTAWEAAHGLSAKKPFPAIRSGAIYAAKTLDHAKGIAKEEISRLTGFQGMSQGIDPRMGNNAKDNVAKADEE